MSCELDGMSLASTMTISPHSWQRELPSFSAAPPRTITALRTFLSIRGVPPSRQSVLFRHIVSVQRLLKL